MPLCFYTEQLELKLKERSDWSKLNRTSLWAAVVKEGVENSLVDCILTNAKWKREDMATNMSSLYNTLSNHVHGRYQTTPLHVDIVVGSYVANTYFTMGLGELRSSKDIVDCNRW